MPLTSDDRLGKNKDGSKRFNLSNSYRNFHSEMIMTVPHTDVFYGEKESRLIVSQENVRSSMLRDF